MELIPDDPIVACMLRTGYPSWMLGYDYEEEEEEEREEEEEEEEEDEEG